MSDPTTLTGLLEQQRAVAATFGVALFGGTANALRAPADLLWRAEGLTADFPRRQRQGCLSAQRLMEQPRDAREPLDVMNIQQKWLVDAAQPLMDDTMRWQSAGWELPGETSRWSPVEAPATVGWEPSPPRMAKAAE